MDLDSVGILIWKRRLITESSNKFRPIKYLKCLIVGTSLLSPVAKTPDSQCRGPGLDPRSGN